MHCVQNVMIAQRINFHLYCSYIFQSMFFQRGVLVAGHMPHVFSVAHASHWEMYLGYSSVGMLAPCTQRYTCHLVSLITM